MTKFLNYNFSERLKNTEVDWTPESPHSRLPGSMSDFHFRFQQNIKTQPKDWIYRSKKISYCYNELGFREKSFKDIDWAESVVIFGCSMVAGDGLALGDTIPQQLSRMLKIPTVNLGVRGSAVDFAFFNSMILFSNYPRPKAVIHLWTSLDRYSQFSVDKPEQISSMAPWRPNYQADMNWAERSKYYIAADRLIWKDTVPRFEGSFFEHDDKQIKKFEILDRARDLAHPGILSAREAATIIATDLEGKIK